MNVSRFPRAVWISVFFAVAGLVVSQEVDTPESQAAVSRDYRGIALGMGLDEVKELLKQDPTFDFRGESDVSLLERPRASLIETGGSLFVDRGTFQFEEEKLTAITIDLSPDTMDWYTMYRHLEDRYGIPGDMDPTKAWWEDEQTRLALERPLTVKYLDKLAFDAVLEESRVRQAWREGAREAFLDDF